MFSRQTGQPISEIAHIFESIETILTTPIGSRVMRREFGSHLPRLVDEPLNRSTITAIYAATNEAIAIWEPRVRIIQTQMDVEQAKQGIVNLRIILNIDGEIVEGDISVSNAA